MGKTWKKCGEGGRQVGDQRLHGQLLGGEGSCRRGFLEHMRKGGTEAATCSVWCMRMYLYYTHLAWTAQESRCCGDVDGLVSMPHEGGKHRTNTVPLHTLKAPGAFTCLLVRLQEWQGWDGAGGGYVRDYAAVILVFGAAASTQVLAHSPTDKVSVNTAGWLAARERSRTAS